MLTRERLRELLAEFRTDELERAAGYFVEVDRMGEDGPGVDLLYEDCETCFVGRLVGHGDWVDWSIEWWELSDMAAPWMVNGSQYELLRETVGEVIRERVGGMEPVLV